MKSILPALLCISLALSFLKSVRCAQYNLTYNDQINFLQLDNNSTSNVLDFLELGKYVGSYFYYEQYYLMSIDGAGMRVAYYETLGGALTKTLKNVTSLVQCFINNGEDSRFNKYNPKLYYDRVSNCFTVIYKPNINITGCVRVVYNLSDVSIIFQQNLSEHLSLIQPSYFKSAFFLSEIGVMGVIQNVHCFNGLTVISQITPISPYTLEEYLDCSTLLSQYSNYILMLDAVGLNLNIYQPQYSYPNMTGLSLRTSVNISNGVQSQLESFCWQAETYIYVHYSNGSIITYTPSSSIPLSIIQINTSFSSIACYYDGITNSIMLVDQNSTTRSFLLNQFELLSASTIYPTIMVPNSGFFSFEPSQGNSFSIMSNNVRFHYYTTSCHRNYQYILTNFTCHYCPTGCAACNGTQFCSTCMVGYTFISNYCCLPGYYPTYPIRTCLPCTFPCFACQNLTFCYSCQNNYTLLNDFCYLFNSTLNTTNATNATNSTNQNSSNINSSQSNNNFQDKTVGINFTSYLQTTMNNTLISFINSFPSSRSILKTLVAWLSNFDDFYLFQFHQRDYGTTINEFFNSINYLQNQKWSAYNRYIINASLDLLKVNQSQIFKTFNFQEPYSSAKFVSLQNYGESFYINSWSFVTTTLVLSLLMFLIGKLLFKLLFNHRFSLIFRPFAFGGYLCLMLTEGNIQFLIFYMTSEIRMNFFANFQQKAIKMSIILIFYICCMFCLSGYLLFYMQYKKLLKYFIENSRVSHEMIAYFLYHSCLKQFIVGVVHNMLRKDSYYFLQLSLLILVDICSIIWSVRLVSFKHAFQYKSKIWCFLSTSFIRVLIIQSLIVQQIYLNNQEISLLINQTLQIIIILYIAFSYFNFAINIAILIQEAIKLIQQKENNTEEQQKDIKKTIKKQQQNNFNLKKSQKIIKNQICAIENLKQEKNIFQDLRPQETKKIIEQEIAQKQIKNQRTLEQSKIVPRQQNIIMPKISKRKLRLKQTNKQSKHLKIDLKQKQQQLNL